MARLAAQENSTLIAQTEDDQRSPSIQSCRRAIDQWINGSMDQWINGA